MISHELSRSETKKIERPQHKISAHAETDNAPVC